MNVKLRSVVESQAQERCEYCHYPQKISGGVLHIEHIIPRSARGTDKPDNLALACPRCNGHKSGKVCGFDPVTRQHIPLFHPRRESWVDHFRLDRQTGLINGLTPTGRVTVRELHINEPAAVIMRQLLIAHNLL